MNSYPQEQHKIVDPIRFMDLYKNSYLFFLYDTKINLHYFNVSCMSVLRTVLLISEASDKYKKGFQLFTGKHINPLKLIFPGLRFNVCCHPC